LHIKDYLKEKGIPIRAFARKIGISHGCMHNIVNGFDMKLSVAMKIEKTTEGQVSCRELAPPERLLKERQDLRRSKNSLNTPKSKKTPKDTKKK
jgi:DNA-binding transcriptional regulator YdaS (Cro superfamily)